MLYHDSHSPRCRAPIGPVPCGGSLTLRFVCDESDRVLLRTWDGAEGIHPMESLGNGIFEVTINVPDSPMLFWYDFIIPRAWDTVRYGNAPDQLGGVGCVWPNNPPSYQVTVYDPAYEAPAFLRTGVMYQIFPDRYARDADAPSMQSREIAQAHPEASFHEDWNERPALDIDPDNGDNRALDFFGGTLRGIREHLEELAGLGVSILYLNPIFRARTNHRYDTGDYALIDPILGTEADFCDLAGDAARLGIRILCDGVFSHTGADSRYFNRFGRYDSVGAYQSAESPYADWYTFEAFPDRYRSWWGFYTLPALNKDNPACRRFLLDAEEGILPMWIRRGARGWRLDVADELPMDLLREMRRAVKNAAPDACLIGEVWEDASNKVSYGVPRSYCLGDTLDSVMNYPLRRALIDFFTRKTDAADLVRLLLHQREVYPAPFLYSLMNLLGSHDRVRALNAFAGYDREGAIQMDRAQAREITLSPEETALAKKRYLAALTLLCALPGVPTVYYGDEVGMQGMSDPWNRAPMNRTDPDLHLRDAVKTLLSMRRASPMRMNGFCDVTAVDPDTVCVTRYARDGKDPFGHPLPYPPITVEVRRP